MEAKKRLEVLIVEDDLIVSRLHKFSLGRFVNHEPPICSNGKEAIEHLDAVAEDREGILVFLDLNMPVMNGWDFLKICRSRPYAEKLNVVIVTSSSFKDDKEKAQEYDIVKAYFSKPLKQENISEIFRQPEIMRLVPN